MNRSIAVHDAWMSVVSDPDLKHFYLFEESLVLTHLRIKLNLYLANSVDLWKKYPEHNYVRVIRNLFLVFCIYLLLLGFCFAVYSSVLKRRNSNQQRLLKDFWGPLSLHNYVGNTHNNIFKTTCTSNSGLDN